MADSESCAEIGSYRGVTLEVRMVDSVHAEVDVSVACLFTHQIDDRALVGGLANLDQALDGKLTQLRAEGAFRGLPLETLLIDPTPAAVKAPAVLVVGMGEPELWSGETSASAVACALRVGAALGAGAMGFAPSVLDTGIEPQPYTTHLYAGLMAQIDALHRVHELGLAKAPSLQRWVFGAGAHGFEQKVTDHQSAFAAQMAKRTPVGSKA